MYNKMEKKLLLLIVASSVAMASAFNLEPPENKWIIMGDKFELKCRSSLPLKSCSWTTPYGKNYPLSTGLTAESGRFEYAGNDAQDCGISIKMFEEKDVGKWSCLVSVVNGSEVTTAEGHAQVAEAHRPTSVVLSGPMDDGDGVFNVSATDDWSVDCVVENARPKPLISWFVDDVQLHDVNVTESTEGQLFVQTIAYEPDQSHINKSLKCVVDHVSLEQPLEASVTLSFSDDDVLIGATRSKNGSSDDVDNDETSKKNSFYIVGIVGAVVIALSFVILFASSKKLLCFSYLRTEASATPAADDDEDKKETELKSTDSCDTAHENDKVNNVDPDVEEVTLLANANVPTRSSSSFSERFASFFRLNKSHPMTTKEVVDVEAAKEDKEKNEVDANGTEAEADKTETNPETEIAAESKSSSFGERFASFFRLRQSRSVTSEEKDVEAGTREETEMKKSEETETQTENKEKDSSAVENEKGEKDVEEKEKKCESKKTDVLSCFAGICGGGIEKNTEGNEAEDESREGEKIEEEKEISTDQSESCDDKTNGNATTMPLTQTPV